MKRLPGGKCEFTHTGQTFINVTQRITANVNYIQSIVQRRWGSGYILVTADGLEIEDISGTQGIAIVQVFILNSNMFIAFTKILITMQDLNFGRLGAGRYLQRMENLSRHVSVIRCGIPTPMKNFSQLREQGVVTAALTVQPPATGVTKWSQSHRFFFNLVTGHVQENGHGHRSQNTYGNGCTRQCACAVSDK